MKVDPRFLKEEGTEVFTGNELLVKGLLETEGGTHLWTGYPGSPVAGFFDCIETIQELPKQYGISAMIANNEALSAAMVNGSQMSGLRAITAMKSVGVHVAADALALGNLAGAHPDGGAIVVCGDDPWSDSTQVPADSRFLAKHLHMPVMEPATYQELKDWIDLAFKLSRESELYIGYIVTTNQADGGGSVNVRRNHFPKVNTQQKEVLETAAIDLEKMVLLPPRTWRREQNLPARYERLWKSAARHGVNKLSVPEGKERFPVGFVTSGMAATYLDHALQELGLAGQIPILKLGITYPLDPALIADFAAKVDRIVVVEERRGFLEEQIALLLGRQEKAPALFGKQFPFGLAGFPDARGLNPSLVIQVLTPLLLKLRDEGIALDEDVARAELALIDLTASYQLELAARSPTFCAGCPHRDSASVLREVKKDFSDGAYMKAKHRRGPVDLLFHGDTGCYTMLMFEPNKDLMHNYSGMGLGGATGMGIDPFISNKQVVFMGDSTFFHSGQVAISNSVKNAQDITYIILDNRTTAMTGHQSTPGIDTNLMGETTFVQSIDKIVAAIADDPRVEVIRVNPEFRDPYRALLEDTILKDGVKIVIADKECGITFHRRKNREEREEAKARGFVKTKTFININTDVCENCLECTKATGCPGLTFTETEFGRKVQTDLSWCVADTACTKIHACPSFEEITVVRTRKPISRLPEIKDSDLPDPVVPQFSDRWHVYLAGIGGMGIASATATLVRAAHREGHQVLFCDKNGLAIRNGGVYSQVTFLKQGDRSAVSSVIPYGKADLILGIDALEAARSLDPSGNQRVGSVSHTAAIVNTAKTPTILTLMGKDDFCVDSLESSMRRYTRGDDYFGADISELSERVFGTKIYANIMMLGVAFQRGQIPLSLESLEWGIRETVGAAATANYLAFKIGRKLVVDAERSREAKVGEDGPATAIVAAKAALLRRSMGNAEAEAYQALARKGMQALRLDPENQSRLVHRLYELVCYENSDYAADYLKRLSALHEKDEIRFGYAATNAALWNMHRVMAIKDEIYVAHLLTSEEKYQRDRERYHIDPALGDRAVYGHLNRPEFVLGGRKIRFHLKSRPWMLNLMKRAKILRRLLPGWHGEERGFRDWYLDLASRFQFTDRETYQQWVEALRLPEQATGYREVRYPKMREARRRAEEILRGPAASVPHDDARPAAVP